jgi:3-oxoacyl-[acyl-carrier protein] reductase
VSAALDGRVALVTGASRGIGFTIAAALAAAGAEVIACARNQGAADETARRIGAGGGRARGAVLDVASDDSVAASVPELLKAYGSIPLLVNNAGVTRDNLLLRMKKEDWDQVIDTNLTGAYRMCRALVPAMIRARYGRIVNVTSVVAEIGNPGQANYCASKAGIEGMTRSLARELGSRNITVNCVAPGFIDTDMTRALGDDARAKLLEQVPLGRLGTPEDVAAAVLYLVGPGGDYVTGSVLAVNGGMSM